MEETVVLQGPEATVTSSRIQIGSKTYATRNVGSVGITTVPPKRGFAIAVTLIGIFVVFGIWWLGLLFLAIGAAILLTQKASFRLMMLAGGGEVMALESRDRPHMQGIHDAVAQAIAVR